MSEDNTRKATDVLISIESKLEALLNYHKSQDLNLKILSNKLNSLTEALPKALENIKEKPPSPKFIVEMADSPHVEKISSEKNLQIETSPTGIRRTSRDFQEDNFTDYDQKVETKKIAPIADGKIVQVTQRVVDKNQKSIFLADVEIKNVNGEVVQKIKTNSVGKWSTNLEPGQYRVNVYKRENASRQKINISQDISVDSVKSIQILSDLIVK